MELVVNLLVIFLHCNLLVLGNNFNYNLNCKIYTDEHFSTVNCHISHGQTWQKEDFRDWIKETRFVLNINCSNNGSISLRRPFGINGLEGLHIYNCYIKDYFDYDFTLENNTRSVLQNLTLSNCVLEYSESIQIKNLRNFTEQLLKQEKCFIPKGLRRFTFSNVRYNSSISNDKNASQLKNEYKLQLLSCRCRYDHLAYIKISNDAEGNNVYLINALVERGIFPSLQELYFSNNKFVTVPDNLFTDNCYNVMPNLQKVDLSGNRIEHLSFLRTPPKTLKKGLEIDLSRNQISEISNYDMKQLEAFSFQNSVNMRDNPVRCCQGALQDGIGWFVYQMKHTKVMKCRDQKNVARNISVVLFNDLCKSPVDAEQCYSMVITYIAIGCTLAVFIFVFIGCIGTKYKSSIMRFCEVRTTRKCHCVNQSKNFDAFISYSSLDERWVYDVLCTKLKSKSPDINLCLHHKDFVPGACISENIINSVENSRFTLLILSKNFIESEWCHMEFQKAFHQTLKHRRHLLVILLEDVDINMLDIDLRFFLQTYTYLKYSDGLFWEKLSQTLSQSDPLITQRIANRAHYQLLPPDYKSCIESDLSKEKFDSKSGNVDHHHVQFD